MILLKPRRGRHCLSFGADEFFDLRAEGRIGQQALKVVPRDRLQDSQGVITREFPQRRIKLPPQCVGGMTPRPAQTQGQFSQVIEPLDFRGEKAVYRVADMCMFVHGVAFRGAAIG
jgi:hypothetical protein